MGLSSTNDSEAAGIIENELRAAIAVLEAEVERAWGEVERVRGALAGVEERWLSARERANHAEDEAERLRGLIDKHNDECRECPVIEA
jgi:chromosome segregation ATPase